MRKLWCTDPYTSWSSVFGFSGTLGGAWNFGAATGTTETSRLQVSNQLVHYYILIYSEWGTYLVSLGASLVVAPPSLEAKGVCLLRLCRAVWTALACRPSLPSCWAAPLWLNKHKRDKVLDIWWLIGVGAAGESWFLRILKIRIKQDSFHHRDLFDLIWYNGSTKLHEA